MYDPAGVPRSAGGNACFCSSAGGEPVRRSPPQRPVRIRAERFSPDQRGAQEEGCGIPAEDSEGLFMFKARSVLLVHARLRR